jgi:hypothetical protein
MKSNEEEAQPREQTKKPHNKSVEEPDSLTQLGTGGELHQVEGDNHPPLTTQTGAIISDYENSLKAGPRGPTLLEDHLLLEKIQHFDHARIPERIVHARGFNARTRQRVSASSDGPRQLLGFRISHAGVDPHADVGHVR